MALTPTRRTRRHNYLITLSFLACVGTTASACGGPSHVAAPTPSEGSSANVGAALGDAGPPDDPTGKTPPPKLTRVPAPLCGCSLCKPVISDDACTTDADCAPATPCHAEACVARSKAQALPPGVSCTAILRCETVDANTCGCLEGRCALYPRKDKGS